MEAETIPTSSSNQTLSLKKLESFFPRAYDALPPFLKDESEVEVGISNGLLWAIPKGNSAEDNMMLFFHAIDCGWNTTP